MNEKNQRKKGKGKYGQMNEKKERKKERKKEVNKKENING